MLTLLMPSYMKFMKEILTHKRRIDNDDEELVVLSTRCSAILKSELPPKLKDLGSITIVCTLGNIHIEKTLCDSGATICCYS